jgi:hypothetical protein
MPKYSVIRKSGRKINSITAVMIRVVWCLSFNSSTNALYSEVFPPVDMAGSFLAVM